MQARPFISALNSNGRFKYKVGLTALIALADDTLIRVTLPQKGT